MRAFESVRLNAEKAVDIGDEGHGEKKEVLVVLVFNATPMFVVHPEPGWSARNNSKEALPPEKFLALLSLPL